MNSGFGVVREGMFDFSRKGSRASKDATDAKNKNVDQRRVSIVDARFSQNFYIFQIEYYSVSC